MGRTVVSCCEIVDFGVQVMPQMRSNVSHIITVVMNGRIDVVIYGPCVWFSTLCIDISARIVFDWMIVFYCLADRVRWAF